MENIAIAIRCKKRRRIMAATTHEKKQATRTGWAAHEGN